MAHIEKYKAAGCPGMLHHYKRDCPGTLARDNVDESRTAMNYTLGSGYGWEEVSRRVERASEAAGRAVRKDAVVMADVVVTRPQNVPEGQERSFFEACYDYLAEKVGAGNVLGGYVHMDETTPHMHFAFTPMLDGRFNFKKLCPRSFYQEMHQGMQDFCERRLGYAPEILLGDERQGEKQLSHLSQGEYIAAKAELARVEQETRAAQERLERLRGREEELAEEVAGLQPLAESVAESTRYLAEHRGDGEREASIAGEIAQLRADIERVDADAVRCREAAGRAEAEREASVERVAGMAGLRERLARSCEDLGERVGVLAGEFLRTVGGVVWNVSECVRDVLRDFGIDARAERPGLDYVLDQARAAADWYNQRHRGWDAPSQGRGLSR